MGLYERDIGEGTHVYLKEFTAFMVADSCNGVAKDVGWDVRLYKRVIEECADVTAIFNLARLIQATKWSGTGC